MQRVDPVHDYAAGALGSGPAGLDSPGRLPVSASVLVRPPAPLSREAPGTGSAGIGGLKPAAGDWNKWFEASGSSSPSR